MRIIFPSNFAWAYHLPDEVKQPIFSILNEKRLALVHLNADEDISAHSDVKLLEYYKTTEWHGTDIDRTQKWMIQDLLDKTPEDKPERRAILKELQEAALALSPIEADNYYWLSATKGILDGQITPDEWWDAFKYITFCVQFCIRAHEELYRRIKESSDDRMAVLKELGWFQEIEDSTLPEISRVWQRLAGRVQRERAAFFPGTDVRGDKDRIQDHIIQIIGAAQEKTHASTVRKLVQRLPNATDSEDLAPTRYELEILTDEWLVRNLKKRALDRAKNLHRTANVPSYMKGGEDEEKWTAKPGAGKWGPTLEDVYRHPIVSYVDDDEDRPAEHIEHVQKPEAEDTVEFFEYFRNFLDIAFRKDKVPDEKKREMYAKLNNPDEQLEEYPDTAPLDRLTPLFLARELGISEGTVKNRLKAFRHLCLGVAVILPFRNLT